MAPDISTLVAVLDNSNEAWEKEEAILVLVRTGAAEVARPLSRLALADNDVTVRVAAIQALVKIGGDQVAGGLATALQNEDVLVRRRAVGALGHVDAESVIPLLHHVWKRDPDPSIRDNAALTLAQLGEPVR